MTRLEAAARDQLQTLPDDVLTALVRGDLDAGALLRRELANRGLDATGRWVGFAAAAQGA